MLQQELEQLEKKFKQNEQDSLAVVTIPNKKYLCIRMDGFKASKNHLKDKLTYQHFHNSLYKASKDLFKSFKNYLTREYKSSVLSIFVINDEVSVILNNDNNHNDAKRIMKLCSLFASTLSVSMTKSFNTRKYSGTIAFDARPIILEQNEISEYLRYRYLIATRYAYWKVLKLNKIDGWHEAELKKHLDNAIQKVQNLGIEDQSFKIIDTYKLYILNQDEKVNLEVYKINDISMLLGNLNITINNVIAYLQDTKTY